MERITSPASDPPPVCDMTGRDVRRKPYDHQSGQGSTEWGMSTTGMPSNLCDGVERGVGGLQRHWVDDTHAPRYARGEGGPAGGEWDAAGRVGGRDAERGGRVESNLQQARCDSWGARTCHAPQGKGRRAARRSEATGTGVKEPQIPTSLPAVTEPLGSSAAEHQMLRGGAPEPRPS